MGIGKAAAVPVLLAALGAARGADAAGPETDFSEGRRDPLEFCSPGEVPTPPPPPPPEGAAEFVREAQERIIDGDLDGADLMIAEGLLVALRAGDRESEARLRDLREKVRGMRTKVDAENEFRKLGLSVTGVAWSESNPVAIVNGALCVPGDVVEGATIDAILPGEVVFEFKGVRMRKTLLRPSVERVKGASPADEPGERE
ncbi:MAG: hypothetical protein ACYTKD_13985 [Planctomycetota bacterium]|jgi:hypothetical protein